MINERAGVFVPNFDNGMRDLKKSTQALSAKMVNVEQSLSRMDFETIQQLVRVQGSYVTSL